MTEVSHTDAEAPLCLKKVCVCGAVIYMRFKSPYSHPFLKSLLLTGLFVNIDFSL